MTLMGILRNTYIYKCDVAEAREEERERQLQVRLQAQRKLLLITVQSLFPKLISLAETQADQIKDATVVEDVIAGIVSARTLKEARRALQIWNQTKQSDF